MYRLAATILTIALAALGVALTIGASAALAGNATVTTTPATAVVDTVTPAAGSPVAPVETATTDTAPTPLPEPTAGQARVLSQDRSLRGAVLERTSAGDRPTLALVELQLNGRFRGANVVTDTGPTIPLFTDERGEFTFTDIPAGQHLLWVWGGLGFVNVVPNQTNSSVFIAPITVAESGTVSGAIPDQFVMLEKPPGVLGFPVRSGAGGGPVARGSISVRAYVAQPPRAPQLPNTGAGEGGRDSWNGAVAAIAIAAGLLATGFAVARGMRR